MQRTKKAPIGARGPGFCPRAAPIRKPPRSWGQLCGQGRPDPPRPPHLGPAPPAASAAHLGPHLCARTRPQRLQRLRHARHAHATHAAPAAPAPTPRTQRTPRTWGRARAPAPTPRTPRTQRPRSRLHLRGHACACAHARGHARAPARHACVTHAHAPPRPWGHARVTRAPRPRVAPARNPKGTAWRGASRVVVGDPQFG